MSKPKLDKDQVIAACKAEAERWLEICKFDRHFEPAAVEAAYERHADGLWFKFKCVHDVSEVKAAARELGASEELIEDIDNRRWDFYSFAFYQSAFAGVPTDHRWINDCWFDMVEAGLAMVFDLDDVIIGLVRPKIYYNEAGELHRTDGPALEYRGAAKGCDYYLNGIQVPEWVVTTPAREIDCKKALKTTNADVRREIVRKVGVERLIQQLGAETVEKTAVTIGGEPHEYELLKLDIGDGRRREYLKMLNPSIGVWHVEGVPPGTETVAAALAFRNGTTELPERLT